MITSQMYRLMGGDGVECYKGFMDEKQDRSAIVAKALQQYIPRLHEINSKSLYPDEILTVESGEVDQYNEPILTNEIIPITRIPLAIEKDIINKKSIFAFGGGIILEPTKENSKLFEKVEQYFYDSKLDLVSKEIITDCMASTQSAIIFYAPSDFKGEFKYKIVSPLKGDALYPYFDEDTGDMIAFGREYKFKDKERFDLYVKNEQGFVEIRRYENGTPRLVKGITLVPDLLGELQPIESDVYDIIQTPYTKLPIIYMELPQGECDDIAPLRRNYEVAYSGFWDQNDRTGDPILFGKGDTLSLPAKGKRGKYIEGSADSDLKFLTPENATESRELQFKMAENYMYSLCNAVKFDLDTFKGTGVTSGEAIDKLLTPMFLDAKEKQDGILGMFYQRVINWLLHETRAIEGGDADLKVYVKFRPMSFKSDKEQIELALLANGNKPVVTHYESIVMAGLSSDPMKTLEELNNNNINGENN